MIVHDLNKKILEVQPNGFRLPPPQDFEFRFNVRMSMSIHGMQDTLINLDHVD